MRRRDCGEESKNILQKCILSNGDKGCDVVGAEM
jgi:hypothetical protein